MRACYFKQRNRGCRQQVNAARGNPVFAFGFETKLIATGTPRNDVPLCTRNDNPFTQNYLHAQISSQCNICWLENLDNQS